MNKDFIKWAQDNYKERIDRGRTIHPFLSSVRKWADDKVASVFREHGCSENFNSIYNESQYRPNFFDKILFKLEPLYKRIGNFKQIKEKTTSLYQLHFEQRFIQPFNSKVDQIHMTNSSNIKSEIKEKSTNLNGRVGKIKIISFLKNKYTIKRERSSSSFIQFALIRSEPQDEYTKLFLERELEYWKIRNLKFRNSFKGFFMAALEVKRDYVLNLKTETKIRRDYVSLTSKLFAIVKYKYFPNIKLNRKSIGKLLLGLGLILSFNLRYSMSYPFTINEYNREKEEEQIISKLLIENPNSLKKLQDIIEPLKEKEYIKILEKEITINKEIVALNEGKSNLAQNNSRQIKNDSKKSQSRELFSPQILDEYNLNLQVMNTRIAVIRLLVTFIPLIISIRKYRAGLPKNQAFLKFALYYFILNEISIYMAFLEQLNIKNFVAMNSFQGDKNEMQNYFFYKNNLHNIYSLKN